MLSVDSHMTAGFEAVHDYNSCRCECATCMLWRYTSNQSLNKEVHCNGHQQLVSAIFGIPTYYFSVFMYAHVCAQVV